MIRRWWPTLFLTLPTLAAAAYVSPWLIAPIVIVGMYALTRSLGMPRRG